MPIPIDEQIRRDIHLVLHRAKDRRLIDSIAYEELYKEIDSVLAGIEAGDAMRRAASAARDKLMLGCRSNGGWMGAESMEAYSILVGALGKPEKGEADDD